MVLMYMINNLKGIGSGNIDKVREKVKLYCSIFIIFVDDEWLFIFVIINNKFVIINNNDFRYFNCDLIKWTQ